MPEPNVRDGDEPYSWIVKKAVSRRMFSSHSPTIRGELDDIHRFFEVAVVQNDSARELDE